MSARAVDALARGLRGAVLTTCLATLPACASGPPGEQLVPARFVCNDGQVLKITFNTTRQIAVLRLERNKTAELASQRPASGMWFKGAGYELRGAGDTVRFTVDGRPAVRCVQTR
jgi:hypothetical protein